MPSGTSKQGCISRAMREIATKQTHLRAGSNATHTGPETQVGLEGVVLGVGEVHVPKARTLGGGRVGGAGV